MIRKRLGQAYSLAVIPLAGGGTAYATTLLNGSSLTAMIGGLAIAATAHFAGEHKIRYTGRIAFAAAVACGLYTEREMSKMRLETSALEPHAIVEMHRPAQSASPIAYNIA